MTSFCLPDVSERLGTPGRLESYMGTCSVLGLLLFLQNGQVPYALTPGAFAVT